MVKDIRNNLIRREDRYRGLNDLSWKLILREQSKSDHGRLFLFNLGGSLFTATDNDIHGALQKGVDRPVLSQIKGISKNTLPKLPIIPFPANIEPQDLQGIIDLAVKTPERLLFHPDSMLAAAAVDAINYNGIEAPAMEAAKIVAIADWLRRKIGDFTPSVAITLGSGLGQLGKEIDEFKSLPYNSIPFLPVPAQRIEGHDLNLKFGELEGKKVAAMEGRFHPYEGLSLQQTVRLMRSLRLLGSETAIITNATGAIPKEFAVGDIVVHDGAINLNGESVLKGPNLPFGSRYSSDDPKSFPIGKRFPPIGKINDPQLLKIAKQSAVDAGLKLHKHGFYAQFMGPEYENDGLINFLEKIGVTNVGMSSFHELIAAKQAGLNVLWYSFNSNPAAGKAPSGKELSHAEVVEAIDNAKPFLSAFIRNFVKNLP